MTARRAGYSTQVARASITNGLNIAANTHGSMSLTMRRSRRYVKEN
jgi:hypothetical protein